MSPICGPLHTGNAMANESNGIGELFDRLIKARFSGTVKIDFIGGQVESVGLNHVLAFDEWKEKPIPIIEPEEEFQLKP
jgi:hypothetical protein